MIRAHADAVLALLFAVTGPTVYEGAHVTNEPGEAYIVVWLGSPDLEADRLSGEQQKAVDTFTTVSVGRDTAQVRLIQEKVHAALLGMRPVIDGRTTTRIKHQPSPPIREDRDVSPSVVEGVDVWQFMSVPST